MFGRNVERPWFSRTPTHVEALNRLLYLVETEAAVGVIRGETGSGRSSVLKQLRETLVRRQIHCAMINVAGMDAESLLWHLVGAFALDLAARSSRAELLLAVREELQGRVHCGARSVVVVDDLDLGCGDIDTAIRFLTATASQTQGILTVICAASTFAFEQMALDAGLLVELPRLSQGESREFARQLLSSLYGKEHVMTSAVIPMIADLADGSPQRLTRICHLLQVVHEASPTLPIDDHVVREVALEVMPRAVA